VISEAEASPGSNPGGGLLYRGDTMPKKNDKWLDRYIDWRETSNGEEVFTEACLIALSMASRGFKHYSMQGIVYVVRYHRHLKSGPSDDGWKVNNNYTSYLAREIMTAKDLPENFFETREQLEAQVDFLRKRHYDSL